MKWIKANTIRTNVKVNNWQEAVRVSGELLVSADLIEPRYIDAMIETTKDLGPYCVIAPGVAIPHARPVAGVKESGFSAITLAEPVEFGNIDNDPVYLVLAFCALDHDSHIESLTLMARAISQDGFIEQVIRVVNGVDLEKILNTSNK